MGPSSARKIEVEESNTPTARPLDAALRQTTTNDSDSVENDNPRPRDKFIRQNSLRNQQVSYRQSATTPNPSYPSIDQQFNSSYSQNGLQPSVGEITSYRKVNVDKEDDKTFKRIGRTAQMGGRSAQVTGSAMKVSGTVMRSSGAVLTRAGAALSGTGAGAIVGVPLAVAGGALTATGAATRAAGEATNRAGRNVARAGKKIKSLNPKKAVLSKLPSGTGEIANRVLATEVSLSIFSWSTWVWIALQLPLAILALVFFGLAVGWESVVKSFGWVGTGLSYLAGLASSAINALSGIDITVFDPKNFFMIANAATMFTGYGRSTCQHNALL